jgi:signal transduction histidine kinase
MSSPVEDARSTLDAIAEEAQRSLRERPSISIRTRVSVAFSLWLIVSLGVTVVSILTTARIQSTLYFLEATDHYAFEVHQARRFEKNYFLYRTNLDDALEHVRSAREILQREGGNIIAVVGLEELYTMTQHLVRYEQLLAGLKEPTQSLEGVDIEGELREHGAQMVTVADQLLAKERQTVNSMLVMSRRIPLVFLALLVLSIVYFAMVMARQVFAPLKRIMRVSHRIADGDFTPITAQKGYRDEFSQLAMAMNHMIVQLVRRHEMLAQAQKLKAVGTLTAGVAHELNNPINNIMLTANALHDDYAEVSDEERLDMVNDLVSQSERAQRIVRNLLDFARESEMEAGAHEVQGIIEDTLRLATNQIKLAKVKIKGELAPNLPPIYGDQQQLKQVFLNLVLNALDAMPKGGSLSISCNNTRDREHVCVEFTDTGVGIPEHRISDIFNPFFTTKSGAKGTGLGLAVSRGIIRQHGGDIKVKSQEGTGTTFSVLLPVAKVPAAIPDEDRDVE